MSVCLGNITDGNYRIEFVKSLLASRNSSDGPAVVSETLLHMTGPYLDDGRNQVVEAFLTQSTADILLFIDSDVAWEPAQIQAIEAVIDPVVSPVVGGLYYSGFPVAYRWGMLEGKRTFVPLTDAEIAEGADGGLVKVDAIGTGFLGIHRDTLMAMGDHFGAPQPWFAEETFENIHHGEDYTFCHRLSLLGIPVFLMPLVRVKHYKVCCL